MSKFRATQNEYNNGFHITFENGYTISVQFVKVIIQIKVRPQRK